jgi:sortase A
MKQFFIKHKNKILKALVYLLELLVIFLILYLFILPIYPRVQYQFENKELKIDAKNIEKAKEATENYKNSFPKTEYAISPNRIIIKKIGVNAPIVETKNSEYGLSLGSWHVPESSTPDKGGNTVITGHRFKYLPPNNLTFYLFHKLEKDDIVSVIWKDQTYYYKITQIKKVPSSDFSILAPSDKPILTMFTCDPIYSTENRLVVIADKIEE